MHDHVISSTARLSYFIPCMAIHLTPCITHPTPTAVAGMGSPFVADQPPGALVVMSKGTSYAQQSYKISESFPYEWIKRKWREGFFITSMGTSSCQRREPAHDREPNFW